KFTNYYKKILTMAQDVAASLNHQSIEPLHLLYCLSNQKGSLAASILMKNKLTPDRTRTALETLNNHLQKFQTTTKALPTLSADSQNILERSVKLAFENRHKYVGTEHLLYSLVTSNDQMLNNYLISLNINKASLENHIKTILKSTSKFNNLAGSNDHGSESSLERVMAENLELGEKSALESFAVDLTEDKIQMNIDPVIGREMEIDRLIQILSRRTKNNPILLGDPGTGKTAIVEGLAKRITENKVPDVLAGKRIMNLDLGATLAGTMFRGEFESRLKNIIEEVKSDPNIILFIDEVHTLMGTGSASGSMDAANIFKPELARGNLRLIGATTLEEYKKHIESDPAFERRFQPIIVNESSIEETKEILRGIKKNYEKYHQVKISPEAIEASVDLSSRYITDKFLPDKAIDLIDEAAAKIKVETTKNGLSKEIKKLEKELDELNHQKDQMIMAEKFEEALQLRQMEDDLLLKLSDLKQALEKEKTKILGTITKKDIAAVLSRMTKIPVSELILEEKQKLLRLEEKLTRHIIGQDEAIQNLSESIRRSRVGLSNPNRPIASFIFLGPSGVGKTETAKVLAKEVFEDEDALIRIDMSEFSEAFNISKLIGAPAGYVGYKEQGKLTDAVKRRPYSVILFDEIEKAHPDVFNLLLPILEDGFVTDAVGKKINFKNTIIIMTSNIGLDAFNKQAVLGFETKDKSEQQRMMEKYELLEEKITEGLKDTFRPEFLNRIDKVVVFKPLNFENALEITKLQLDELAARLTKQNYSLKVNPSIIKYIARAGFSPDEGARGIKRAIQEKIEGLLAKELLSERFKAGESIKVKAIQDKVVFEQ
ncbi:MAG: ATP-dependent Clp protease ATP-binding subunit ClpC, partial [Candidatus Komeilibacteria bacterium CG10_big_fil_rev_8_21_14_0_10_41_13]